MADKFHKTLLFSAFFIAVLLNGCSIDQKTDTPNSSITVLPPTPTPLESEISEIEVSPTEEMNVSTSPVPTDFKNDPSDNSSEELTSEDAKALILERLDVTKYSVDLIDSALFLKGNVYYSFLVSEGNRVYEPALIVDKLSGEIFCYDSSGTVSDYSNFPLYNEAMETVCDWNGTFYLYDSAGSVTAELKLGQGDPHSFEFTLSTKDSSQPETITGVASIRNNTASYTSPEGISLHFVMSDFVVAVTEERPESTTTVFAGVYYFSEEEPDLPTALTRTQAITLLSSLTKEETKLSKELAEYQLFADDLTIKIKNTLCYSISVYSKEEQDSHLITTFYVALDGSRIYQFDPKAGDDVEIWIAK